MTIIRIKPLEQASPAPKVKVLRDFSHGAHASASPRFGLVVWEWGGKLGSPLPSAPVHFVQKGKAAALLADSEPFRAMRADKRRLKA